MTQRMPTGLFFAALLTGTAIAQTSVQPIQWINEPRTVSNLAQRTLKPILVYIPGDSESRSSDMDRQQQRALRDPVVIAVIRERFIPHRMQQTTRTMPMMQALGMPTQYGMYLVALPPGALNAPAEHTKIALIDPMSMTNPDSLLRALTSAYRDYGESLYTSDIKALFDSEEPTDRNIDRALTIINQFIIESADQNVIDLLDRYEDNKRMRREVLATMSTLSTQKTTEKLLELAKTGDRDAQKALGSVTADVAERVLLPKIRSEDAAERFAAYKALTDVFGIKPVKSEKWWENIREIQRDKEIQRVTNIVKSNAEQWRQTYGKIR